MINKDKYLQFRCFRVKRVKANYYDFLCTKMYEILHAKAPKDELDFYLSYAKREDKILELMCGSGPFLIKKLLKMTKAKCFYANVLSKG